MHYDTSTGGALYNTLLHDTLWYGSLSPIWYEQHMRVFYAYGAYSPNYNKSKYKKHIYSLNFQVK